MFTCRSLPGSFLILGSLFLMLSWASAGAAEAGATAFELPPVKREIQATCLKDKPAIDGLVEARLAPLWVPVAAIDWEKRRGQAAGWFNLGWNEAGLYVAVVLPGASAEARMPTGETPPAPFAVDLTLDAQRDPDPGAVGRYDLHFVPLPGPVSRMDLRSLASLRNRWLGAGSRPEDQGLVLWGEGTHTGFLPDGVETRWAASNKGQRTKDEGQKEREETKGEGRNEGDLTFEAFIPWRNFRVEGLPEKAPLYFDLAVARPGMGRSRWTGGARGERDAGGTVRLLGPSEAFVAEVYSTRTLLPLVRTALNLQQGPIQAAFPPIASGNAKPSFTFSLIGPDGQEKASATAAPANAAEPVLAELKTSDLPDGLYQLRVQHDGAAGPAAECPVRLAGRFVADTIRPERARLEAQLTEATKGTKATKEAKTGGGAEWQGRLERARACLGASVIPPFARPDDLTASVARLDDARAILDAFDAGRGSDAIGGSLSDPAGFLADGRHGPLDVVPVSGDHARLTVQAGDEAGWDISPLLYGTFSEPIGFGRPIYRGIHAQALENPSFEWGTVGQQAQVRARPLEFDVPAMRAIAEGKWLPLLSAPPNAVAAPWIAVGVGEAKLSTAGGAFNSEQCQKIEAGPGARGVGVAQATPLPAWRCSLYRLKCYLRAEGPAPAAVAALYHEGAKIAEARFDSIGQDWKAFEAELRAPIDKRPQNAFLLSIVFDGPGTLFIDQTTLIPADAVGGLDPQVVEQLRAMKTGWIRWPGGNYASAYHWRDGVGPLDRRPTWPNPAWAGLVPNSFGTDEYLRMCELVGLEPFICVNAGNGTPQEAAEWVEYCNGAANTPMGRLRSENGHPKPYGVRHWNVGNELWGRWQIGYCEAQEYAARYEAFAKAMRERDPSIRFVACALGPYQGDNGRRWNGALMDRAGKGLEAVDFHTYVKLENVRGLGPVGKVEALAVMPVAYERALEEFRRQCLDRGLAQVHVVIGEYNSAPGPGVSGRLAWTGNLLAYAGWLHDFIRQGDYVRGANATEFSPFNPRAIQFDQLHPRCELFELYATRAGTRPVRARLETPVRQNPRRATPSIPAMFNLPLVDAVALKDPKDGSLAIGLINRDLRREIAVELNLEGFNPSEKATRYLYWDDFSIDKAEKAEAPSPRPHVQKLELCASKTFSVPLPPHSVTLVKIPPTPRE